MTIERQGQADSLQCCEELIADGWREYPDQFSPSSRCFFKRFDTPTRCFCNDEKPGVQVKIEVSFLDVSVTMEMSLRAGLKDGTWIEMLNYCLPNTVEEVTALIPRLLAMLEVANEVKEQASES